MTPSKSIVHTLLSKWIFAIRTARQEGISTNLLIGLVTLWLLLFANAELWSVNRPGFPRHSPGSLRNAFQTLPVTADC